MMTFEKVLEVFNDYLNKDSVLEVVNTKRGYTVMIWDEKDEQWFGVEHCKAPELLRDALLDGYRDFLEQELVYRDVKQGSNEIKFVKPWVLPPVLYIHNRAWRKVYQLGKIFLCPPFCFPSFFYRYT